MKYRIFKRFLATGYLLFLLAFGVLGGFVLHSLLNLRGIKRLEKYSPPVPTEIVDVKGKTIAQFFTENREIIEFNDLPVDLVNATLATEDERFFSHYGFNPWRIMKALWRDIVVLRAEQGGSTITIQLSKLLFLTHKKSLSRKIKELWYAIQIEKQYSKKEILLFYFNQVNYGHGSHGVEVASKFFFKKPAHRMNFMESALLAGIPKSPANYSPIRHAERSMRRHKLVLYHMVRNGVVDENQLDTLVSDFNQFWQGYNANVRSLQENVSELSENHAPYFVEYVRKKLAKELPHSYLYERGLKVHTTLDLSQQQSAERRLGEQLQLQDKVYEKRLRVINRSLEADVFASLVHWGEILGMPALDLAPSVIDRYVRSVYGRYAPGLEMLSLLTGMDNLNNLMEESLSQPDVGSQERVEGAVVSVQPHTGYITSMVGGSGFHYRNQFNRAVQTKRQVGSIIKPFVYAAAMDAGLVTVSTRLDDSPVAFGKGDGVEGYYIPKNYSGKYSGAVLVRQALKRSINVCAVRVLQQVGIVEAREYAAPFFRSFTEADKAQKFPTDLTMVLGSGSFSPLEVAVAYAVIANGGREVVPLSIRYVTDLNGEVIRDYEAELKDRPRRQLMEPTTAYIIYSILSDVFRPGGTAYRPALLENFRHKAHSAGKTGTSSLWKDAWFVGANRYISTCVWVGYDSGTSLGRHRSGGKLSAPVWIRYQKDVLAEKPILPFDKPEGLIKRRICKYTGLLAGPYSKEEDLIDEYYKKGTEPTEYSYYRVRGVKNEWWFRKVLDDEGETSESLETFQNLIENRD